MNNNASSIRVNYLYNIAFQILNIIIPIITTPYVSRILQPDGIGAYSFTFSIVTYFGMFGTLGISTYGQLMISSERDDDKTMSLLFWELYLTRIISLGFVSIIYVAFIVVNLKYRALYTILIIQLIAQAVDVSWALQGLEQFKTTVSRNFVVKIITTVLIFILIKKKEDLLLYVALLQTGALVANITMIPALKKYLVKIDRKELQLGKHWRDSFVYFIPTIATSVYTVLDKSMLGMIIGSDFENGYYEQAHKIEQMLVTIVTSLGTVTLPRVSYLFKTKKIIEIRNIVHITTQFIMMISIPMCAGVIVVSDNLVNVFLGPGYESCSLLLRVFSVLIIVVGLDNTIGKQCLMPVGRQKMFNISVICGAVVNFGLNLILIPKISSLGAAIASVLAEITILLLFIVFSRDYINLRALIYGFFKYSICSVIMMIVVFSIGKILSDGIASLILQICMGLLCYFLCLFLIRDKYLLDIFSHIISILKKKGT